MKEDKECSGIVGLRWFWWKGKLRHGTAVIVNGVAFSQLTKTQTAAFSANGAFKSKGLALAAEFKMSPRFGVSPGGELIQLFVEFDKHRGIERIVGTNGGAPYWVRYSKSQVFKSKAAALRKVSAVKDRMAREALKEATKAAKVADRARQAADKA